MEGVSHKLRAPSLIVAAGLSAGILSADLTPAIPGYAYPVGVGAAGLLICASGLTLLPARRRRRPDMPWRYGCLLAAAAFSAGMLVAAAVNRERMLEREASGRAASTWTTFTGSVCDMVVEDSDDIRSLTVCTPAGARPGKVRISFLDKSVRPDGLHVGDRVLVTGRAGLPGAADNPFGFDESRWLASHGVHSVMVDPARLRTAHTHSSLQSRARAARNRLRSGIDRRFDHRRHRALAAAILLGDRSDIDRSVRDRFVRSGLMHLLALSGLHVGLIGGIVWLLIDSVLRRVRLAGRVRRMSNTLLWCIAMGIYGTVVGWPVSVIRALVMAAAFLAASTAGRRCSPWHVYGIAAAALLLLSPENLYAAGFQLSFAAVGGIILVRPEKDPHPSLVGAGGDNVRMLSSAVRTSVAAGVSTMPVLLFHFGSAPTAGIVLSPPGILLMGPILASTLTALLMPVTAAGPMVHVAAACLDALLALGAVDVPWMPTIRHIPGRWTTMLAAPVLAGAAVWLGGGRRRFMLLVAGTVTAVCLLSFDALTTLRGPVHSLVFFAAGQGDAALLRTASGRTLLVDAAPGGAGAVLDYCRTMNVDRIDTVVLTHGHADHTGGLPDLSTAVGIGRIVHTGWLDPAGDRTDRIVSSGDTLGLGSELRIDVLNPDTVRAGHGNDDSIVLRIRIGRITALLMGDAEKAAETRLLNRFDELLNADIVKAGHHGSQTSSTPRFVRVTDPRLVVLSAGRNNRFGHPSPLVLDRWQTAGADVHLTSAEGALVVETNGLELRIRRR